MEKSARESDELRAYQTEENRRIINDIRGYYDCPEFSSGREQDEHNAYQDEINRRLVDKIKDNNGYYDYY